MICRQNAGDTSLALACAYQHTYYTNVTPVASLPARDANRIHSH